MVCTDTGRSVWESLSENLRRRLGCEVGMGELGVPVAARDLVKSWEVVFLPFDKTGCMTVSGTVTSPMLSPAHAATS